MPKLGLLGKNISYSFSKAHFTKKFADEGLPFTYENFDIEAVSEFPSILKNNPDLVGLNVTIPYKEQIIPYLDSVDKQAKLIGAVNTITFSSSGELKGYNTDSYGFKKSIEPHLKPHHKNALILGTGGASKAVAYALKALDIDFDYVSRMPNNSARYTYSDLTESIIHAHTLLINCTPLGTHPNVNAFPNIPYGGISKNHLLYDLIYNPLQTQFLSFGAAKGAVICNGLNMLEFQAKRAWKIWNLV
ncbi:shikimate dehydrogenase family protein [Flavobacteriaceae bacterium LMO-SS05]